MTAAIYARKSNEQDTQAFRPPPRVPSRAGPWRQ